MKILKYEKKKNGMYQVFFDNDNNIDISEEIILKYNLLLKKDIDNSLIDKMPVSYTHLTLPTKA